MDKAAVLAALNELAVPPASLVVMGGSALALYSIRPAKDIDLIASPETFELLAERPDWTREDSRGVHRIVSSNGLFDVWRWWYNEQAETRISYDEVVRHTRPVAEGYKIPTPQYLLRLKRMGMRVKDQSDVQLLEDYMKKPRQ